MGKAAKRIGRGKFGSFGVVVVFPSSSRIVVDAADYGVVNLRGVNQTRELTC